MLTGNLNFAHIPAPVTIFEAQSYLQKITNPWAYTQYILRAAATSDKLTRLELILGWTVAGLRHVVDTWRKPFNPLLGETWQGEAAGGRIKVCCEQISHHPPVASYVVIGPGFRMTGTMHAGVQLSMKWQGFKQIYNSKRRIEFDDGDIVDFQDHPSFIVKSTLLHVSVLVIRIVSVVSQARTACAGREYCHGHMLVLMHPVLKTVHLK